MSHPQTPESINPSAIAIIGMSCRFPGASNLDTFWQNLRNGVESISTFNREALEAAGVAPELLNAPNYVPANGILEDIEGFDAHFFDFSATEAATLDPQHRLFLEQAWQALEHAGYDSERYAGSIGVYAGTGINTYLLKNLIQAGDETQPVGDFQLFIRNDKDFLPTRVSYLLNLKGPSINVQTACSTSLVAVHLACQGLLNGECDMALAGSASVRVPQRTGYLYQDGMILSPDGHCRAFDARAAGTVAGSGVGLVVLKRLDEAIQDGDCVHGVILGSAINNDGAAKVGYTAPSVDGQAAVIAEAQAIANVAPQTITYVEAHGTGTAMGDPIEVTALTQAFNVGGNVRDNVGDNDNGAKTRSWCALGSVKTNVGHLDTAAGIAGLIKTVLALKHRQIPPSLNFEQPNPAINFSTSPFYLNHQLADWPVNASPRRAGVSSFGIGGTNAHLIVEEAPSRSPMSLSRPWQLFLLSAKTATALEATTTNLSQFLYQFPEVPLADVAYTLKQGRKAFIYRRFLVCEEAQTACQNLAEPSSPSVFTDHLQHDGRDRPITFLFPGQGSQYVGMARDLYEHEPTFRQILDRCNEILQPYLEQPLLQLLYPDLGQCPPYESGEDQHESSILNQTINQTLYAQPALYALEYALAQLWIEWGVQPDALLGHSIGEYVAATVAGVFSIADALKLVAVRARLMQALPPGAMLAVPLSVAELQTYFDENLTLAVVNSPNLSVVSGKIDAIDTLEQRLATQEIQARRLHTSHAFHSPMMEPMLDKYRSYLQHLTLSPPQIPIVSNLTGTWLKPEEATDPEYWVKHLRHTVLFAQGIELLLENPGRIFLEVGPGRTLTQLTRRHPNCKSDQIILTSLRHPQEQQHDQATLLNTLGQLWLAGVSIDWHGFYTHEQRQRIPLPTYPFEHQRYWIEPQYFHGNQANGNQANGNQADSKVQSIPSTYSKPSVTSGKKSDIADWFYLPTWKPSLPPKWLNSQSQTDQSRCWLFFIGEHRLGTELVQCLHRQGDKVVTVVLAEQFTRQDTPSLGQLAYGINPEHPEDYIKLMDELAEQDLMPQEIVHFWSLSDLYRSNYSPLNLDLALVAQAQTQGCKSLLFLAQALGKQKSIGELQLTIVSHETQVVTGTEQLHLEQTTLMGALQVIPQEYPHIRCRSIDLVLPPPGSGQETQLADRLLTELRSGSNDTRIAYRGVHRWVPTLEPLRLESLDSQPNSPPPRLQHQGVYLITGGLGAIALTLAEDLAKTVQARLVLVGRSPFPNREEWSEWLIQHPEDDATSTKIRKLQALEQFESSVLVLQADVADLAQMQAVFDKVQNLWGTIHGVIHTAGILGDGMMQQKNWPQVEAVLLPKVQGTLVLDALFRQQQQPLDFLVLCSSIASYKPGFGQLAYCSANAFLDAFAYYRTARDGSFTVSINWDGWQLGMGVTGTEQFARRVGLAQGDFSQAQLESRSLQIPHPLFKNVLIDVVNQQEIYISDFDVEEQWVLKEHRLGEQAALPGTAYLEMIRAACLDSVTRNQNSEQGNSEQVNPDSFEIEEIAFLAPLFVADETSIEVRTILQKHLQKHLQKQPEDQLSFAFSIVSQSDSGQSSRQTHAVGKVQCKVLEKTDPKDIVELRDRCNRQTLIPQKDLVKSAAPGQPLILGQRWNNLQQIQLGENQGLALLELPAKFEQDLETYWLHPALMDSATSFLTVQFQDNSSRAAAAYLPFSYKGMRIYRPLSSKIYSYIQSNASTDNSDETLQFKIALLDEQGNVLVEIEEYTLRKIVGKAEQDLELRTQPGIQSESSSDGVNSELSTYENFALTIASPGSLHTLQFQPTDRPKPGINEVEVAVSASALNFREVLIAMGLFPDPIGGGFQFGMECAGTVTTVGEGVKGIHPGDEVIVLGQACISHYVIAPAHFVIAKPPHLTMEEAATIPNAFGTAYYSLMKVGCLQPGDKVLIHAAAGGVGNAAVRIAQWVGAEIFATAGSEEKRGFLRSQGVQYVMDSRSLDFADQTLQYTNGRGVDVVLNSLGGEFISKGLSVLASYGRFLELGMRDILNNSQIGLLPFQNNLSFHAIFLDRNQPNFNALCQEVIQHFNDKHFSPLPHQTFLLNQIYDAFEFLAQAKHIGKVVISLAPKGYPTHAMPYEKTASDAKEITKDPLRSPSSLPLAQPKPKPDFRENWLLPSEGVEVFHRVLNVDLPQVLIATSDFLTADLRDGASATVLENLEQANLLTATIPTHARPELKTTYVAPRSEIEQTIAQIWREVLGLETVGIHDNFFELGGDSLLIVQVRSKIQQALNKEYSTADAFEYPTINTLATYLSGEQTVDLELQQASERASKLQAAIAQDKQQFERRRRSRG